MNEQRKQEIHKLADLYFRMANDDVADLPVEEQKEFWDRLCESIGYKAEVDEEGFYKREKNG